MLFNSYEFLFVFFPLVLAGYGVCVKAGRAFRGGAYSDDLVQGFLLAASLVFYGCSSLAHLPVLIGSMAFHYAMGWLIRHGRRKRELLAAGVAVSLALLIGYKYVGDGSRAPLGISFFTFTQIAFLVECYRGSIDRVKPLSYGLYVSFFPKIMQGPIALPGEMFSQFFPRSRQADWENIYRNLYLFVLGLFKKVLIADTLGKAVDFGYANPALLNAGDGLIVMLSYTLQLYFDFSGYCDMAMGIGGMLGIELPLNFRSPYRASDLMEFWKRWHITLTGFFTRYLYIPLGGNRKGRARTYFNSLVVFLVSGIWHGNGWQFLVWGMMHGVLYVLTRAWKERKSGRRNLPNACGIRKRIKEAGSVLLTFLYVNVAWIFFRAPSVKEALGLIRTIISFDFGRINRNLTDCFKLDEFWYVIKVFGLDRFSYISEVLMAILLAAVLGIVFFGKSAPEYVKTVKPGFLSVAALAFLFVWSVLSLSGVSSFLYVNF